MQRQRPIKIMLVDDEPDILDFLGYSLSKEGYDVITASGGMEAIRKAIRERPDLVVLDIMMPECDGIRVCDRLKHSRRAGDAIILFMTAGSLQFARHAKEVAHADDFVLKPVLPSQLVCRIRSLLQRFGKELVEETFVLEVKDAVLNKLTREFIDPHRYLKLKKAEFDILWLLASSPDKTFSITEIQRELRIREPVDSYFVKKYILRLKEKIGDQYIRVVTGFGYRFGNEH